MATAVQIDDRPSCFRYPRGNGIGIDLKAHGIGPDLKGIPLEIGKGLVRKEGSDICLIGYGAAVNTCMEAREKLAELNISATVIDARFCKPLDSVLMKQVILNFHFFKY